MLDSGTGPSFCNPQPSKEDPDTTNHHHAQLLQLTRIDLTDTDFWLPAISNPTFIIQQLAP